MPQTRAVDVPQKLARGVTRSALLRSILLGTGALIGCAPACTGRSCNRVELPAPRLSAVQAVADSFMLALAHGDTAAAIRQQADTSAGLLWADDNSDAGREVQAWRMGVVPLRGGAYADTVSVVFELPIRTMGKICYGADQVGNRMGFHFIQRGDRWLIVEVWDDIC